MLKPGVMGLVLLVVGMGVGNQVRLYPEPAVTAKTDVQQAQEQEIPGAIKMPLPQGSLGTFNNLTIKMRWQTVFQHLHQANQARRILAPAALSDGERGNQGDFTWSSALELNAPIPEHGNVTCVIEYGEGNGLDNDIAVAGLLNYDALETGGSSAVSEIFYSHDFFNDKFSLHIGKMDWVAHFDTNQLANSEEEQFFSRNFVVNPVIFGPEGDLNTNTPNNYKTFGTVLAWSTTDWLLLRYGLFENDGDYEAWTKKMVNFLEADFSFQLRQGPGNLRTWFVDNGGLKSRVDGRPDESKRCSSAGLNIDQSVSESTGVFLRFGKALRNSDEYLSPYTGGGAYPDQHISGGVEFKGILWDRKEDVLGVGLAHNHFGRDWQEFIKGFGYHPAGETMAEVYYHYVCNRQLALSPGICYIGHATGFQEADGFWTAGLRLVVDF